MPRARVLQARSGLVALRSLARSLEAVVPALAAESHRRLEQLEASTVQFAQVRAADLMASGAASVAPSEVVELERLFSGPPTPASVGVPPSAPVEQVQSAAAAAIARWRTQAGDPLADPTTVEVYDIATRVVEQDHGATLPRSHRPAWRSQGRAGISGPVAAITGRSWLHLSLPTPVVDTARSYTSPDFVPRAWQPDRPGDLVGFQPAGEQLGYQGPDQGFALKIANGFRDRLQLQSGEHAADAIKGCLGIALKRALRPTAGRQSCTTSPSRARCGVSRRQPARRAGGRASSSVRRCWPRRALHGGPPTAPLVPDASLLQTPQQVAAAYPAGWRSLVGL